MEVTRRLLKGMEVLEPRLTLDRGVGPINTFDKSAVTAAFFQEYQQALVPQSAWSGDISNCVAGTNSNSYTAATLRMINYFRNMAGLPNAALDEAMNTRAQEAALMMDAHNSLSHSPDKSWTCYSRNGAEAAASSNLYLGRTGATAIAGYVEDPGSANANVGHRRWILHPPQVTFGTGSTDRANALWVIGPAGLRPVTPETITWPPKGFVPNQTVFPRWSFSLNLGQQNLIDFGTATVQMTLKGKDVPLDVVARSHEGYGDRAIVWQPRDIQFSGGPQEQVVRIELRNVKVAGISRNFGYEVTIFDPAQPWQNSSNPLDTNADGNVAPIDALFVINLLNAPTILSSQGELPASRESVSALPWYDVNGDSHCTAVDVLLIVNAINQQAAARALAEGEKGTEDLGNIAETNNHLCFSENCNELGGRGLLPSQIYVRNIETAFEDKNEWWQFT